METKFITEWVKITSQIDVKSCSFEQLKSLAYGFYLAGKTEAKNEDIEYLKGKGL